jgi:hypothetical protein
MNEFTYEQLKSGKLMSALKVSDSVSVKLTKKQSRVAISFIEKAKILMGEDGRDRTVINSFVVLLSQLFLLIRMVCFYSKLFELFIFYFNSQPEYTVSDNGDSSQIIRFFKLEGNVAH